MIDDPVDHKAFPGNLKTRLREPEMLKYFFQA